MILKRIARIHVGSSDYSLYSRSPIAKDSVKRFFILLGKSSASKGVINAALRRVDCDDEAVGRLLKAYT